MSDGLQSQFEDFAMKILKAVRDAKPELRAEKVDNLIFYSVPGKEKDTFREILGWYLRKLDKVTMDELLKFEQLLHSVTEGTLKVPSNFQVIVDQKLEYFKQICLHAAQDTDLSFPFGKHTVLVFVMLGVATTESRSKAICVLDGLQSLIQSNVLKETPVLLDFFHLFDEISKLAAQPVSQEMLAQAAVPSQPQPMVFSPGPAAAGTPVAAAGPAASGTDVAEEVRRLLESLQASLKSGVQPTQQTLDALKAAMDTLSPKQLSPNQTT